MENGGLGNDGPRPEERADRHALTAFRSVLSFSQTLQFGPFLVLHLQSALVSRVVRTSSVRP